MGNSFIFIALTGFVLRGSYGVKEGSAQALCFGAILWTMETATACWSLCYKDHYMCESIFPGEFFCQFQNFQCVASCMSYQTSNLIQTFSFSGFTGLPHKSTYEIMFCCPANSEVIFLPLFNGILLLIILHPPSWSWTVIYVWLKLHSLSQWDFRFDVYTTLLTVRHTVN